MKTKNSILNKLGEVKRPGMGKLITWLEKSNFFTSPASSRFHLCFRGGLAQHSWDVFQNLEGILSGLDGIDKPMAPGQKPLPVTKENVIVASLLHDVNKIGLYKPTKPGGRFKYYCDKAHPKGHGELSITFIKATGFELEKIEELMIRFHMGIYGTFEMGDYCQEYHLKNVHDPEEKNWTKEEKAADKEARYCTSLRNAWYHQPICKLLSIADELATMEEKCKDYKKEGNL